MKFILNFTKSICGSESYMSSDTYPQVFMVLIRRSKIYRLKTRPLDLVD